MSTTVNFTLAQFTASRESVDLHVAFPEYWDTSADGYRYKVSESDRFGYWIEKLDDDRCRVEAFGDEKAGTLSECEAWLYGELCNELGMTLDVRIQTFNTGRRYTAQGQRIAFIELARETHDLFDDGEFLTDFVTFAFADVDRHIDGQFRIGLDVDEPLSEKHVMQSYDSPDVRSDFIDDSELRAALYRKAARSQ